MREYLELLHKVAFRSHERSDRTGTGTWSRFGDRLKIDLESDSFPLLTTKKIHFRSVARELEWFIRGGTNVKWLNDHGVTIWDEWANADGELGPVYGKQWRDFGGVDQLGWVVEEIKRNPTSRRLVVSAWNPPAIPHMALPPCHVLFQFYVRDDLLSCQVYQRSADIFLGVPFNIASYALLTHMVASVCALIPHKLLFTFGDVHLYKNHINQALLQLERSPRPGPRLVMDKIDRMEDFDFGRNYDLSKYDPHPAISAPISV